MPLLNKQFCVLSVVAILGLAFSQPLAGETYTYDDIGRLTGVVYDDGSSIIQYGLCARLHGHDV